MAQIVATFTLRWALIEMGKAIPGAAGGWLFKAGADAIFGGNDQSEQIRKDLAALSTQVKQVQASVDRLSKQLSNVLLQLRSDNLNSLVTKITSSYDGVYFAIDECLKMPKEWSEEQKEKKLQDTRIRIEEILRSCMNDLPSTLEGMHSLLNSQDSQSVLSLARDRSLDLSTDFLSHTCKLKAFVMPFWIAEAKALSLLQMAVDAPNIHFAGGESTIKKYTDYASAQETTFDSIVGPHVIALVNAVMERPSESTAVDWQNSDQKWLIPFDGQGVYHLFFSGSAHPWVLKPVSDIHQPSPDGSYAFEMITPKPLHEKWATTGLSWGGYGAGMGYNDYHPSWYIKPGVADKFSLQFSNASVPASNRSDYQQWNGQWLSANASGVPCCCSSPQLDKSNHRQWYTIKPQKG